MAALRFVLRNPFLQNESPLLVLKNPVEVCCGEIKEKQEAWGAWLHPPEVFTVLGAPASKQPHLQKRPRPLAPKGSGGTWPLPGSATSSQGSPEQGGLCLQHLPAALGGGERGEGAGVPHPGVAAAPRGGGSGRPGAAASRGGPGGGPGGARLAARPLRIAHGPSPPGGHVAALAGSREEGRGAQRWPWPWADRRWVRDGVAGRAGAGRARRGVPPPR